jgi:hypothetical protein
LPLLLPSADIEAGQGMIASGRNIFAAYDCPANSYGVTGKIFGLGAAPCKPCPRNMITDGLTRVNNSDACVNDDGFGYASEGWLSDHTAGTCCIAWRFKLPVTDATYLAVDLYNRCWHLDLAASFLRCCCGCVC